MWYFCRVHEVMLHYVLSCISVEEVSGVDFSEWDALWEASLPRQAPDCPAPFLTQAPCPPASFLTQAGSRSSGSLPYPSRPLVVQLPSLDVVYTMLLPFLQKHEMKFWANECVCERKRERATNLSLQHLISYTVFSQTKFMFNFKRYQRLKREEGGQERASIFHLLVCSPDAYSSARVGQAQAGGQELCLSSTGGRNTTT